MIGTLASALQPLGTPKRFDKGNFVFLEGDRAADLYVLEAGRVRIWTQTEAGQELTLEIMRPLAVFGEVAPILGGRREASAEVMSPKAIVRTIAWGAVQAHPRAADLTAKLLAQAAGQIARRDRRLLDLAYLTVQDRTELALADLVKHEGKVLQMSQYDLAAIVGCLRETVTRALGVLAAKGIILLETGRITVMRPDLLGAAAPAEGA